MEEVMNLINRKFLKDHELLYLEDSDFVKSCKYLKPYNAHYKEYLVVIDNKGNCENHTVYCKFI